MQSYSARWLRFCEELKLPFLGERYLFAERLTIRTRFFMGHCFSRYLWLRSLCDASDCTKRLGQKRCSMRFKDSVTHFAHLRHVQIRICKWFLLLKFNPHYLSEFKTNQDWNTTSLTTLMDLFYSFLKCRHSWDWFAWKTTQVGLSRLWSDSFSSMTKQSLQPQYLPSPASAPFRCRLRSD